MKLADIITKAKEKFEQGERKDYYEGIVNGIRLALVTEELAPLREALIKERDRLRDGVMGAEEIVRISEINDILGR